MSVCQCGSTCMCVNMTVYICVCVCVYIFMYVCTCVFVSECIFVLFKPLNGDLCSMRNVPAHEIHRFIHVLKARISYRQSSISISHKQALIGIG